jgi:hypothetical protein
MDTEGIPKRILISAAVQQIPGAPGARPWTIWELFCTHVLDRDVRTESAQSQPELGVDAVHVLPNFDSANDVRAYFLTDVGVKEGADQPVMSSITFEVYRAAYDTTNERWYVPRDRAANHTESSKDVCIKAD